MRYRTEAQSIMPFLYNYLLNGLRARLAMGLLLPHPHATPEPRARRRVATMPTWRTLGRDHVRAARRIHNA
jgi:hypothetical protein